MHDIKLIPEHFIEALENYEKYHLATGSFLQAVLCNDLHMAISRADAEAIQFLPHLVCYVQNRMPGNIHGSVTAYREHLKARPA